ncbi:MAG: DUF4115 domain-containing protein [Anaerolineales bacterium]|nr:DUF4115 domain-containing protein [Anaerolineales bacterium]
MQETIGQRLKREREARYLTLEKAAADTRIRRVFLQALESDDFSVMPSAAQGRGFLRNYAEYLDLNIDELIAEIQRNPIPPVEEVSGPLPQVNLAETELPPLTEAEDEEEAAPPFWTRILRRKPKVDSTPELVQDSAEDESVQPEEAAVEEKKKRSLPYETQPDGQESTETEEEAKQSLWVRVALWLQAKTEKQVEPPAVVPSLEVEEALAAKPAAPDKPADAIMAEIGAQLRERREMISLSIDEVERHTHLRAVFVKALEEGAFDKLPSTVQTRGMLSNYASFLDLDVDAVLLRYADALQARRHEKYAEIPREQVQTQVKTSMPLLRTFIAGDLLFGFLMIAVIVGLSIWGIGNLINRQTETDVLPTAPPIVEVLGSIPAPTASAELTFVAVDDPLAATSGTDGGDLATPEVTEIVSNANVVVSVFAVERVFVRISVDGEVVFEGRMAPRENKVFEANDQVVVLTGNGSALRVTYNGTDLGLMGAPGEVVNRVYLITGVATPTATIPPTPTNTPLTTPTFTPTVTPTSTVSP